MNTSSAPDAKTIKVFVSSPGDLKPTRIIAERVIRELNALPEFKDVVTFVPGLYENHTPRGAIGERPQGLVNSHMFRAEEADIYVGMLWSKLGTKTEDKQRGWIHDSGTIEEFNEAYRGYEEKGLPRLLFYRCITRTEPTANPEDVAKVERFFANFNAGKYPLFQGMIAKFADDKEFAGLLKRDLVLEARFLLRQTSNDPAASASSKRVGWWSWLDSRKHDHEQEVEQLIKSMEELINTSEEAFPTTSEADRELASQLRHAFRTHYRALPDPYDPERAVPDFNLPRVDDQLEEFSGTYTGGPLRPTMKAPLLSLYDQWDQQVLFVGGSGMGKTFSMHLLMRQLLYAARHDKSKMQPIPVLFNLPSWVAFSSSGMRGDNLAQWLANEMVWTYSIKRKTAQSLIDKRRIVICLDGLDELSAGIGESEGKSKEVREQCVAAINDFLADSSPQVILCCREDVYNELKCKPQLGQPLQAQLLDQDEVDKYFSHNSDLKALHKAMTQSALLRERARVPLYLGYMSVAYSDSNRRRLEQKPDEDKFIGDILHEVAKGEAEWLKSLTKKYVRICVKKHKTAGQDTTEKGIHTVLKWMATTLENKALLLDDMQPDVLAKRTNGPKLLQEYRNRVLKALSVSLMVMMAIPPALANGFEFYMLEGWPSGLMHGLVMWVAGACILLPCYRFAFSAPDGWRFGLWFAMAWALLSAVLVYRSVPIPNEVQDGTLRGALNMLGISFICSAVPFVIVGMQVYDRLAKHRESHHSPLSIDQQILPIEPKSWRLMGSIIPPRGAWICVPFAALVYFATYLADQVANSYVATVAVLAITFVVGGYWGTGGARTDIKPNQGMDRSLLHALKMTLIFTCVGVICWGGFYWAERGWVKGIAGGLMGLTFSFTFFACGGIPVIRQKVLGRMLSEQGILPGWNYWSWKPWGKTVAFLDDLVQIKLLRRLPGGYTFRHSSLLEHYRDLSRPKPPGG